MQADHAPLLAQVIPALGAALGAVLIMETRELPKTARADAEPGHARISPRIRAWLSFLAMAVLTVSEILCLWAAATGGELHGIAEVFVWVSLSLAMVMAFLLPPATLVWRLYQQPRRVPAHHVDHTVPPVSAKVSHRDPLRTPDVDDRQVVPTKELITEPRQRRISSTSEVARSVIGFVVFGAIMLIPFVGIPFFVASVSDPHIAFQSGDEPRNNLKTTPAACTDVACIPLYVEFYNWELDPRTQRAVRATFVTEPGLPDSESVTGSFRYLASDCPGARLEWTLQVEGSPLSQGDLDETLREVTVSKRVMKQPGKATVSVRRTDDQPCGAVFQWDKPRFSSGWWW